MNYPHSNHVGGVWERQIRTIRSFLTSILHEWNRLDTASLRTFIYEAMAILNSGPLEKSPVPSRSVLEPLEESICRTLVKDRNGTLLRGIYMSTR